MNHTGLFIASALLAAAVSMYGIFDAWLTLAALNRSSRAGDINARILAKGGIRTASIRSIQMLGLVYVSTAASYLEPRPAVAGVLETVWVVVAVVCWLSTVKELLAMRDRRHIAPVADAP